MSYAAHTVPDARILLMAAEKVLLLWQLKQAEDWCHPEFRRLSRHILFLSPRPLRKCFGGCGPLEASWSAQPRSSGSLASCSGSAIRDSSLAAAWMKAHCCPCACVLLWT